MRAKWYLIALPLLMVLGVGLAMLTSHPRPAPEPVRAAPELAADTVLTRIAVGSCLDQKLPEPIWDAVIADKPDVFVFMGDNVYGDVAPDAGDVAELRAAYAAQAKNPGFRRLRANVPTLEIWDDHDYGQNDAGSEFPLKDESKAAFLEFWGISDKSPRALHPGLYDSMIIGPEGKRVQIILLDTRWFRDPLTPTDQEGAPGKERYVPNPDPALTLLGADQWAWLENELKKPAEVRLIVSSIQLVPDGHGWERWGNLPAERDKFYALIEKTKANGVVIVSGDRHIGALYKETAGVPYPLFEMTSSSLNKPANITDEPGPQRIGPIFNKENYGMVTINWEERTLGLTLKDVTGQPVLSANVALESLVPVPPAPKQNSVIRNLLQ